MKRIIPMMLMVFAMVAVSFAFDTTDNYTQVLRHCRYQASYNLNISPGSNSMMLFASGNQAVPITFTASVIGTPAFGSFTINRYKGPIKWTNGTVYTNTAFAPDYHATIFEKNSGIYDLQDLNYFGAPWQQPISCWEYTGLANTWTVFTNAWAGNGISNRGTLCQTWTFNVVSGAMTSTVTTPTPMCIGANTFEFIIVSNSGTVGSNLNLKFNVDAYVGR